MKAEKYLPEKALEHLEGIDLSQHTEDILTVRENILEDLPYFILNLTPQKFFSEPLSAAHRLLEVTSVNGALCRTKKDNVRLMETAKAYIEANKEMLATELACALNPIPITSLRIKKGDPYYLNTSIRKVVHKAWASATWKGKTAGNDFHAFIQEVLPDSVIKPKSFTVIENPHKGIFLQRRNGMYEADQQKQNTNIKLVHYIKSRQQELEIIKIGVGKFNWNTDNIPIFPYPITGEEVYIVAKCKENRKHLVMFPDISVCSMQKQLGIERWKLQKIYSIADTFQYVLEGYDYTDKIKIEVFGMVPFVHPEFDTSK